VPVTAGDGLAVVAVAGGGADLDRFLTLPRALYAGDRNWVEPLLLERRRHLSPRHNPFFGHAEVAYWWADRDGRPLGRISAQIDRRPGAGGERGIGHFGFLDAADDEAVFRRLLGTAEAWLRARGMSRVTGPFTLSINDESGLLVDGFDSPPFPMMGHAPPYAARHLEALGYAKEKDLIAYLYDLRRPPPPAVRAFVAKVAREPNLGVRTIDKARFADEVATVVAIFNDAWADNWGFVPFAEAELAHLARELEPLLRADDVVIGLIDGEPVAMAVALPNVNAAIAGLGGRLLPFGWLKLLWRLKVRGVDSARVPLMGVRKAHQGTARGAALMLAVIERLRTDHLARGITRAELSWILEDNRPMRQVVERYGAVPYKTYRVFGRDL
jgi:GNAT superfamily N-acetyltransferase